MRKTLMVLFFCCVLLTGLSFSALAQDVIKIGGLATLEGPFAFLGEQGMTGIKLALHQWNNTAGGKKIELVSASTDASPESATKMVTKLVEQDKVNIVIGPLSGSEGIAVKDYAKTHPEMTFINGVSAAQDTTLRDPAPNFFRFTSDGAQWMGGLGEYVVNTKGWKKIVTIAEDYSFPYTNVFGFLLGYCAAGGQVADRFWVPLGNKDYSTVVASIPEDIDAIMVALGGADAVNFLTQYEQSGGDKPIIAGSITADSSVMGYRSSRNKDYLVGTPSAGPIADSWDDPRWKKFVEEYRAFNPEGLTSPSLFCYGYYVSTLACLTALDMVKGDLSNGQKAFMEALAGLQLETPTGLVKLDQNRQAITDVFITEIAKGDDGNLYNKVIKIIPQVDQVLGWDREKFLALGPVGRDNPPCK